MTNEKIFNLEQVFSNSDKISEQLGNFNEKLVQLEEYENSIFSVLSHMNTTKPFYKDGQYGLKVMGEPYYFTDKSLNDFFQKSNSDIDVTSFNNTKHVGCSNPECDTMVGESVSSVVASETRRDSLKTASKQHLFINYHDSLLGLTSPTFAARDRISFSFHDLLSGVKSVLEVNAQNAFGIHSTIQLNKSTGTVTAKLFYDKLDIGDVDSSDIGFGFLLRTGYAGTSSLSLAQATIRSICMNGQISFKSKCALRIKNSSEHNIFNGLRTYYDRSPLSYHNMDDEGQLVFDYIDDREYSKVFENQELKVKYYEEIGKAFIAMVNVEKSKQEKSIVRASNTKIEDILGYYKQLRRTYSTILSQSDIEKIILITDSDPTIDLTNISEYTVNLALERYANDPTLSPVKSERIQELSSELLLAPIQTS